MSEPLSDDKIRSIGDSWYHRDSRHECQPENDAGCAIHVALAEVRRLREENAVLARKLEATAVSVGGPHVEYAWTTGGSEVDRLHTIIRDLDRKHTGALKERNAARADLARAIELLKRDHWSRRAADCACDTCTFLAEMGKR